MRLIDADKLKQSVTNEMIKAELNSPLYCTLECVIADIENHPTAYDVDKIVKELEELAVCAESKAAEYDEAGKIDRMNIHDGKAAAYKNTIRIVKSGGID